ncbi:MAG: hypothetical protein L0332_07440 [Chloroflexi bacterium]|nr:hypothetical protein [Chloroflexota bacterium]MCI0726542.1 hypothetical protein [Chloroflexota bacterium]
MSVITFNDNRGGLVFPFLPAEWQWQIVSRPLDNTEAMAELAQVEPPALRWVKDDKVLDLIVPGLDTAGFLARTGLQLSMSKGGYVLSKRLSRVMRPYRYWSFFGQEQVTIDYNELLDGRLWDGCGLVSRSFIQRLADSLTLDDHHRRELLGSGRFEVTTLHAGGQDKGHVLVVDDLAVDFMFPAGSAKQELALVDGRVFIGLHPVHSEDQMCLDIQSLINLYPFFQPEQLLYWAQLESELFLSGIRDGRLEAVIGRLYDESDLDNLAGWHVGEYLASGGRLMWFAGMVKAVARQHLNRLGGRAGKLRCPAPGGRYYLFPAAVGDRDVPAGHIELDPACATAWVNDDDWLAYIVNVLGGCDGDDAVWVLPFTDTGDGGQRKILVWRSPNQVGEYVLLRPAANSHAIEWDVPGGRLAFPKMDSRLLPPRIDSCHYQYGILAEASDHHDSVTSYSIAAMWSTIERAAANRGQLGAYCNVLLLCKAIYGRLPEKLPATLEAVIDGSVKSGLDLTPVKEWNQIAVTRMVAHGRANPNRAMPKVLLERLPEWLRPQAQKAKRHWLDTLAAALDLHRAQYWADVEALTAEACPPLAVFEHGRDWLAVGKELRQVYSRVLRQAVGDEGEVDGVDAVATRQAELDVARVASEAFLAQWPAGKRYCALLGAAAYLYAQGPQKGEPVRDGLLWQLGRKRDGEGSGREPGIAHLMIEALRQVGVLGEPVWTAEGPALVYRDEPCPRCAGVPVRINGVWMNLLNATNGHHYERMSDVPKRLRDQAKARIADFVQERFRGMMLFTEVTDGNRVITRTPQGNLFGYVQKDHELAAVRYDQWRIAWAHAIDGNVYTILEPVTA